MDIGVQVPKMLFSAQFSAFTCFLDGVGWW